LSLIVSQQLLQRQQSLLVDHDVDSINLQLKQLSKVMQIYHNALLFSVRLKHAKGHPLCMPAAAAVVPVAGGLGTTLPSIDIARTLAKKTIDAALTGKSQQTFIRNLRNV
jgi:hypothetical protein